MGCACVRHLRSTNYGFCHLCVHGVRMDHFEVHAVHLMVSSGIIYLVNVRGVYSTQWGYFVHSITFRDILLVLIEWKL